MNLFAKACGATGPLQLNVEGPDNPEIDRQVFDAPFVTIGRDPRADLCLTHRGISRRHAYLQIVAGRLFCLDLGSRIGTYVGGECHQAGWVERRRTIRIGPYRLRLSEGDLDQWASTPSPEGDANEGALQASGAPHLPRLFLELWDRANAPSTWQIERELALVGTSADCEVRLLDPSVSNFHCSLLRTPTGIWVVDLLGQEGVMVNGTAVRYARVYDGDELHLGNSLIRLRYEMPRPLSPRQVLLPGNGQFALKSPTHGVSAPVAHEEWPGPGSGLIPFTPSVGTPPAFLPASSAGPMVPSPWAQGPEWRPTGAESTAQAIELVNSLLFPMVDQFGLMQQQVLDQFQQSMMMFQTFTTIHHDQMDSVRQEFDQLRDLTQELVALRAELAGHTSAPRDRSAETLPEPTQSQAVLSPPSRAASKGKPPVSARTEPSSGGSGGRHARPEGKPVKTAGAAAGPPGPRSEGPPRRAPERGPEAAGQPSPEIHAWLCQRITAIQKEQQTSWQRIFSLMPGHPQKKPAL